MLHLKDDMDVSSLTFLGTIAHILGPIYLSECFPKVTVLNLGIPKSLLRSQSLCVRHSVTFIFYLWSFLFTVLKSASYHKFGSKETKSFTTVHLSIAILSRRLFSNTMHSKQKGIFIFRMLSLSIV